MSEETKIAAAESAPPRDRDAAEGTAKARSEPPTPSASELDAAVAAFLDRQEARDGPEFLVTVTAAREGIEERFPGLGTGAVQDSLDRLVRGGLLLLAAPGGRRNNPRRYTRRFSCG